MLLMIFVRDTDSQTRYGLDYKLFHKDSDEGFVSKRWGVERAYNNNESLEVPSLSSPFEEGSQSANLCTGLT